IRICKETPAKGESFKDFRSRVRAAKLWDRERPAVILRFLGVGGATVTPSPFMQAVAAAASDDDQCIAIIDRVFDLNPILAQTMTELVAHRAYHKDEIYKVLASAVFKGTLPSRPAVEIWIQIGIVTGLFKTIGIAITAGPRMDKFTSRAADVDVDEY